MDDPSIELYHLWHPPGWGKNPYERFEARVYQFFENDTNYLAYIETAKNIYRKTMNLIINNDNV